MKRVIRSAGIAAIAALSLVFVGSGTALANELPTDAAVDAVAESPQEVTPAPVPKPEPAPAPAPEPAPVPKPEPAPVPAPEPAPAPEPEPGPKPEPAPAPEPEPATAAPNSAPVAAVPQPDPTPPVSFPPAEPESEPEVTITSPTHGSIISGWVMISARVWDRDGDYSHYYYKVTRGTTVVVEKTVQQTELFDKFLWAATAPQASTRC